MIRKTTAVALVLSAVPAALALTLLSGTAQATDTPWQHRGGNDTPWQQRTANDTPWGATDTPWSHNSIKLSGRGGSAQGDDTPWS
ncbi:hypothetical protein JNUCC0626_42530 [Lentzea sp. JNUCC 0626]|uniref:hypothetical protein n=1 Tax=Lentzea sp. JNUCC 0626 TaxID=3367513 RepID=UPI003747E9CC